MDLISAPPEPAIQDSRPEVAGLPSWRRIPAEDAKDEEIIQYVARHNNPRSSFLRWIRAIAAQNERFYWGEQWSWPDLTASITSGGYKFQYDQRFPKHRRMTTNRCMRAADNEIARIGRWEYVPNVGPGRGLPEIEAAARAAKNYLTARLVKIHWGPKRDKCLTNIVIHGTTGALSRWDEDATDLRVESEAVKCPGCGVKLATRRYPEDIVGAVEFNRETIRPVPTMVEGEVPQVELTHCPTCPEPTPLEDHIPTVEEVQSEQDLFGNPLGMVVAKGQTGIEPVSLFRLYPENGGLGIEPYDCKSFGLKTVMSMEEFATRYGHLVEIEKFHPTPASKIFHDDPFLGDEVFSGRYNAENDAGIYDNHIVVDERWSEPSYGLKMGRGLVVADNQVVVNTTLLKEFTPEGAQGPRTVPLVKLAWARYSRHPRMIWGLTPFNNAISPQRRRNEIDTMQSYMREHGVPHLFLPPGVEPKYRDDIEGLALRAFEVEGAPPGWSLKDALFPGRDPITGNAYEGESQKADEDIQFVFGPSAIEAADVAGLGQAAKTARGLVLLSEEAAQGRGPVEREFSAMTETIGTHQLECTWAFHTDEDEYEQESATGRRELKTFKATNLLGQTNVKVSKENKQEQSLKLVEGTKAALEARLINIGDPVEVEQVKKNLGMPTNVGEGNRIQTKAAESAWTDFLKEWKIPMVDEVLHDPVIWKSILGKRWMDDDAVELQRDLGWDKVFALFAGWQRKLGQAVAQDMAQRALYEGQPPEAWGQIYQQAEGLRLQVEAATAKVAEAGADPGALGPPPPMMPPPPPTVKPPESGEFLPEAPEKRIAFALEGMAGLPPFPDEYDPNDPALPEEAAKIGKLCKLVRFYAVIMAFDPVVRMLVNPMMPATTTAPGGMQESMGPGGPAPQLGGGVGPQMPQVTG